MLMLADDSLSRSLRLRLLLNCCGLRSALGNFRICFLADLLHPALMRFVIEARRELAYSTLSVKQVASALGFADEAYFGRLFKRHTGQRPSDFRVSARRELAPASA